MIIRLAVRSLATRPLRSAVLATGFGLGIGVMASLLGVGEVILEQARSPAPSSDAMTPMPRPKPVASTALRSGLSLIHI